MVAQHIDPAYIYPLAGIDKVGNGNLLFLLVDIGDAVDVSKGVAFIAQQPIDSLCTAYDSFADDPGLSLADGYVVKSADFRELKEKIANAIRRKAGPQTKVEAKGSFSQVRAIQSV